jgi:hypothetical protein
MNEVEIKYFDNHIVKSKKKKKILLNFIFFLAKFTKITIPSFEK